MNNIQILGIFYFVIMIIYAIPIGYVLIQPEFEIIKNWEEVRPQYYNRLILTGQAIIGLVIILSIFYLGRIHDYDKDFMKSEIELFLVVRKFKKKYPKLSWEVDKDTFELSKNAEKTFDDLENILKNFHLHKL